jgi:signal transduction histidine kinase
VDDALQGASTDRRNEIEVQLPDGRTVPLGVTPSVLRDQEGVRGSVLIFQDITDVKRMEEQMRRQDRLAAVGELAAGIAHELRNPLASISGSAEVLNESLVPEGEDARLLALMLKESSRVNRIIEEFLDYTRIQPLKSDPVDLARVAEETLILVRNHPAHREGREVELDLTDCPKVQADEGQLKQVLLNLVINGLEAMEEGGRVTLRCPDASMREPVAPGLVEIWVQDDGPGVAPGEQERIFEPFHTGKRGGTGLGLAVVQRIVESHHGHIRFSPDREGRSTFRLYLPEGEVG